MPISEENKSGVATLAKRWGWTDIATLDYVVKTGLRRINALHKYAHTKELVTAKTKVGAPQRRAKVEAPKASKPKASKPKASKVRTSDSQAPAKASKPKASKPKKPKASKVERQTTIDDVLAAQ